MSRKLVQCLAVLATIGLFFAVGQNANAWHRSGGSHGSHGSFGGVFRGSHGGSFGGFFSHRHGSNGGYGSHGGHASHCDCGNAEHADVELDDQGLDPDRDDGVIREESREVRGEATLEYRDSNDVDVRERTSLRRETSSEDSRSSDEDQDRDRDNEANVDTKHQDSGEDAEVDNANRPTDESK